MRWWGIRPFASEAVTASGPPRGHGRGHRRGRHRGRKWITAPLLVIVALVGAVAVAVFRYPSPPWLSGPHPAVAAAAGRKGSIKIRPTTSSSPTSTASTQDPTPAPSLAPSPTSTACPPGTDQVISVASSGTSTGRRQIVIHRPAGPDRPDIPVLYLLHGYPGTPQNLMEDIATALDAQMCRTGVPFVLAAPDGNSENLDTEWGDDAEGRFAIESFVTTATINAVEGSNRRPQALRAIAGVSMGGFGAAAIALRHPSLYSQVMSFGGYFRIDDPDNVFGSATTSHSPDRLVTASTASQLRFFLVEGAKEDTELQVGSIKGEADRFAAILRQRSVTTAVEHPPGAHDDDGWYPAIPDGVDFLVTGWHSG